MKDLENLLSIQQEYEYFTKHCKTQKDYTNLQGNSTLNSYYMTHVLDTCNKYISENKLREKKEKLSNVVLSAILIFYFLLVIFAIVLM